MTMNERKIKEIKRRINPFITPSKLRVCAYVRVSTSNEEQLNSLQNQTDYYVRKLQSNPDYEYCGIFSDSGISGAKENRPGFQAMIEKAKNGEIDLIITKSISRLARNTLMLLKYVRELKEAGVGIIFEEQNINTLSSDGELMLTVLGAIAEEERKSVCSNVRWSKRNKFKQGIVPVRANELLGYDKDKKGNMVINKEQAKIVKEIYKRYLAGDTSSQIAAALLEEGIPSFSNFPWEQSRKIRILSNEKFCGDFLMQKCYVDEAGKLKKNRGELAKYYVRNNHPAIIKRKDWEAAQKIREGRVNKFPFSKMLKCPYCGASLVHTNYKSKGLVYWICNTKMEYSKSACIGINVPEHKLIELNKITPIIEPMVVIEVKHENVNSSKKRPKKDFRLVPVAEYKK